MTTSKSKGVPFLFSNPWMKSYSVFEYCKSDISRSCLVIPLGNISRWQIGTTVQCTKTLHCATFQFVYKALQSTQFRGGYRNSGNGGITTCNNNLPNAAWSKCFRRGFYIRGRATIFIHYAWCSRHVVVISLRTTFCSVCDQYWLGPHHYNVKTGHVYWSLANMRWRRSLLRMVWLLTRRPSKVHAVTVAGRKRP